MKIIDDMQQWMTWEQLIFYYGFCLAGYLIFIVFIYFRNDVKKFGKQKRPYPSVHSNQSTTRITENTEVKKEIDVHTQVHELLEDIKKVFATAVNEELSKEQVLDAIGFRLQKYPAIKGSNLRAGIDNHIINECSIRLNRSVTVEEINALW